MIYDNEGNMCDDRATLCSNRIVEQVAKLYDTLYEDGMTVIEARALLTYFSANLSYTVIMSTLQHQIGVTDETN